MKRLKKFTPLKVIQDEGDWTRIKGKDFDGWIFNKLISKEIKCITINHNFTPSCPDKKKVQRRLTHDEGLKVLKMEIGCNYVLDSRSRSFWVDTVRAWPKNHTKKIIISSSSSDS